MYDRVNAQSAQELWVGRVSPLSVSYSAVIYEDTGDHQWKNIS